MNERCRAGPRSRLRPEERCRSAFEPRSVADKAGVAHIRAWDADSDYVVGCRDVEAGCKPQCNIIETRHAVPERTITHGRVTVAASVVLQHMVSDGRVVAAFGVKKERAATDCCVRVAVAIESDRTNANCRVVVANSIAEKRSMSDSHVVGAFGVKKQCERSIGSASASHRLLRSAPAPVAVFSFAVFAKSVPAPTAVLSCPSVLLRSESQPWVICAGGEAQERVLSFCCVARGYAPSGGGITAFRDRLKREGNEHERDGAK